MKIIGIDKLSTGSVAKYRKNYNAVQVPYFKGIPQVLDYDRFVSSNAVEYSADKAISIHEELSKAKYTDIHQDAGVEIDGAKCSEIRKRNLSFLDKVKDVKEKEKFIKYYEDLTGFPDLKKVSENVVSEFYRVCKDYKNSTPYISDEYDICAIGYNDTCSAGHNKSLPGSDLDGAYVILKGSGESKEDTDLVNNFKAHLWFHTDARILSYNHQAAFPQVYTMSQFNKLAMALDKKALELDLEKMEKTRFFERKKTKIRRLLDLKNTYDKNYVDKNRFYIELCGKLEKECNYGDEFSHPTKELARNFGFLVETIMDGKDIGQTKEEKEFAASIKGHLKKTLIGNLTNLSQLHALKLNPPPKRKLELRDNLVAEYKNMDTNGKYEVIKELIKASCDENDNSAFEKYFSSGEDNFTPLLRALDK